MESTLCKTTYIWHARPNHVSWFQCAKPSGKFCDMTPRILAGDGRWVKMADFPVWVGGLSLDVKENVLHTLFCKFGPIKNIVILKDECGRSKQCGFVNFLSQEVAELAAKKLDGFQVLGQAIKTKGPLELLSTGRSTTFVPSTAGNLEKKDYRPLTDCPYFVENRECFPKPGEVRKLTKTCAQVLITI